MPEEYQRFELTNDSIYKLAKAIATQLKGTIQSSGNNNGENNINNQPSDENDIIDNEDLERSEGLSENLNESKKSLAELRYEYQRIRGIQNDINNNSEDYFYYQKLFLKVNKQLKKSYEDHEKLKNQISSRDSEIYVKEQLLQNATGDRRDSLEKEIKQLKEINKLENERLKVIGREVEELEEQRRVYGEALKNTRKLNIAFKTIGKDLGAIWKGMTGVYNLAGQLNLFKFEKSIKTSALSMGLIGSRAQELSQSIQAIASSTVDFGFDITKVAELQAGYSDELGRAIILGGAAGKKLSEMAVATGLGAEGAGKMAAELDAVGYSAERTGEYIEQVLTDSSKLGLNAQKVTKNISNNIKLLNKYNFKEGAKGLAKMAESATKMGISMESIGGMAEKLFDIEGAVEMSAQLQVMGGEWAKLSDPFKLMYMARNDMEGLQKSIINATKATATFNAKTGEFDISALEMQRLRKIAEATGLNYEELAQSAKNAAKFSRIDSEIGFKVDDPEMKDFIENTAVFDKKKNKFVLKIGTEEKLLSSLSEADKVAIKGRMEEKANMEKRAKDALSFDEKISNIITKFQQMLLPVLEGLEKQLEPIMKKVVDTLNNKNFQNSVKSFIDGVLKFTGAIIKFVTEHPVWTLGLFGVFEATKWIINGRMLAMGFNSAARAGGLPTAGGSMGSGAGGTGIGPFGTTPGAGFGANFSAAASSNWLKAGGAIAGLVTAVSEFNESKDKGMSSGKSFGRAAIKGAGAGFGAWGGAAAGAAIGSVVPVIGTAIGALIGGALGAWGGGALGGAVNEQFLGDEAKPKQNISVDDGIVKFNPRDKFMKIDDTTMIAGTNENGNKDLAKALTNETPSEKDINKSRKDKLDKDNFIDMFSDIINDKKDKNVDDGIIKIRDKKEPKKRNEPKRPKKLEPKNKKTKEPKINLNISKSKDEEKKIDNKQKTPNLADLENIIKKSDDNKFKIPNVGGVITNIFDELANQQYKDKRYDYSSLENIIKNNNENKFKMPGIGGMLNNSIDNLLNQPTEDKKENKEIKKVDDGIVKLKKSDLPNLYKNNSETNLDAIKKEYEKNNDPKIFDKLLSKIKNDFGEIKVTKQPKIEKNLFETKMFNKVVETEKTNKLKKDNVDINKNIKKYKPEDTKLKDGINEQKFDDKNQKDNINVQTNVDNGDLNKSFEKLISLNKENENFKPKEPTVEPIINTNVDLNAINKGFDKLSEKEDKTKVIEPKEPVIKPNVDLDSVAKGFDKLSEKEDKTKIVEPKEKTTKSILTSNVDLSSINKGFDKLSEKEDKPKTIEPKESNYLNKEISNKILDSFSKKYNFDNFKLDNKFKLDKTSKKDIVNKDKKEKPIILNDGIISKKDGFGDINKNDLFKILESNRPDDIGKKLKNNITKEPKEKIDINLDGKEKDNVNYNFLNKIDSVKPNQDTEDKKPNKKNIVAEKIKSDYKNRDLGKLFSNKLDEKKNSDDLNKKIKNKPTEISDKDLNKKLLDKYFANESLVKFNEKDKFTKIDDGAIVAGTKEGGNKELAKILSAQAPGLKNKDALMSQNNNYQQQQSYQANIPTKIDIDFGEITFGGKVEVTHGQNLTDELGRRLLQSPNFLRDISKMVHLETDKALNGGKAR